jgi:ribonuclease E
VASFLLNENRTEIAKIELKQRVNVLMVPNKALETPNYKLERLKHDDPRLEGIEPSYKLAEEIEDPTAVTRRSQEPANKQTPVIKGVLPDAPAPQAAPRAEGQVRQPRNATAPTAQPMQSTPSAATPATPRPIPTKAPTTQPEQGFFAWLKGLLGFGGAPAPVATPVPTPTPTPAPAAPATQREPRRDGRDGRHSDSRGRQRNNGRDAGRDGAARDSTTRDGNGNGSTPSTPSDTRSRRNERPERPERPERSTEGRDNREVRGRAPRDNDAPRDMSMAPTDANAPDTRSERAPRRERSESSNSNPRRERAPRTVSEPSQTQAADFVDTAPLAALPDLDLSGNEPVPVAAPVEGTETKRRSRDRYGRDRGERGNRAPRQDSSAPAAFDAPMDTGSAAATPSSAPSVPTSPIAPASANASASTEVPPESPEPVRRSYFAAAPTASAPVPVPVPVPVPMPVPAPVPVPVDVAPIAVAEAAAPVPALPQVQNFVLPEEQMHTIARNAGLQWITSDADKVAAAQAAIAAEPRPVHVPRQRPAMVTMDDAPLVLVETRRNLSDMPLPFEASPMV